MELFGTNHYQNVFVQTINGRCSLLTLQEFEDSAPTKPDTYYTRAEFDTKKRVFTPDYSAWETLCSCKMPSNPLQKYIGCDDCEEWFHPECENTSPDVEHFVCSRCTSSVCRVWACGWCPHNMW